jgi:hypothetical protein
MRVLLLAELGIGCGRSFVACCCCYYYYLLGVAVVGFHDMLEVVSSSLHYFISLFVLVVGRCVEEAQARQNKNEFIGM